MAEEGERSGRGSGVFMGSGMRGIIFLMLMGEWDEGYNFLDACLL
jgi:hypothetical protein